jgi:26S proteasome regulatory subunit N3
LQAKRGEFYAGYRAACLRLDQTSQAFLLNILIRSYLNENEYEQARNIASKTTFPEAVSNSQFSRYLYYNGRIKAMRLEYTEAETRLVQALGKAPQTSARGFRLQISKLKIVVELLTGEIPERSIFTQPDMRKQLIPYYLITQSVRSGNLISFGKVIDKYANIFIADKNYTLIQR